MTLKLVRGQRLALRGCPIAHGGPDRLQSSLQSEPCRALVEPTKMWSAGLHDEWWNFVKKQWDVFSMDVLGFRCLDNVVVMSTMIFSCAFISCHMGWSERLQVATIHILWNDGKKGGLSFGKQHFGTWMSRTFLLATKNLKMNKFVKFSFQLHGCV